MSVFQITAYDKRKVVRIIAGVDIAQSLLYIGINSCGIVFGSAPETEQRGYPFITLLLIFIICFYLLHMTLALKLLSALYLEKTDLLGSATNTKVWQNWAIVYLIFLVGNCFSIGFLLGSATNTKVWQNWAIVYLIFLVGNCFSRILSAQSWSFAFLVTAFGVIEILWRLVGIYNVGIYIDDLLEQLAYDTPTIKFFSVRFPMPVDYQSDSNENHVVTT